MPLLVWGSCLDDGDSPLPACTEKTTHSPRRAAPRKERSPWLPAEQEKDNAQQAEAALHFNMGVCGTGPIFMLLVAVIKLCEPLAPFCANFITFLLPVLSIVVEFEFGLVVLIIGNDKLHETLLPKVAKMCLGTAWI